MVRKLFIGIFVFFILLFFGGSSFATSLGYGSIADYYPNIMTFQSTNNTFNSTFPSVSSITDVDWSKSFCTGNGNGGSVLFVCPSAYSSSYSGYVSYRQRTVYQYCAITNYTNCIYKCYYKDGSNWVYFRELNTNEEVTFNETFWTDSDHPIPYVGSDVLVKYNNEGAYVFANFISSTLNCITSSSDIENAGIDFPIIFSNAQQNIGLTNLNAYVAVSYQASNDTSNWIDMSYITLTNNNNYYNDTTHSFAITLKNMIDRDLAVGDKIKIEYGWATLDRLGNPHSYSYYNIYTRSTAYVGGSAYEEPQEPGSGGNDEPSSPDYTNTLSDMQSSIDNQTNAINQQTNAINQQTQSIDNLNNNLMNENAVAPNSIGVDNNVQDNTADLSNLYSSFSGAWRSFSGNFGFDLELPNHTHWTVYLPVDQIHDFFNSHTGFRTFWFALWWTMLGGYVVFDFKKMYNKFRTGDLQTVMSNQSPIDNVVKEILR